MAARGEWLYPWLPVVLQNVAVSAYGYRWQRRRFGGVFERELRGFKERESWDTEQWRSYQTSLLRRLLSHAFETVPYYRRSYTAAGLNGGDLRRFELEDLKRLPYLSKDDLRRFGRSDLLSAKREPGGLFVASSGSTGTPTSILYSAAFHQRWSAAFEARVRHWAGVDRRMPRGMIGGRRVVPAAAASPPYYRRNVVEKQTYFSAYHISRATASDYLKGMQQGGVAYMTGYAMSNYFLASLFYELGLEPPKLRAVITSSELLTPAMRELFGRVYGCRAFDSYSGVEACGLITEDEQGELVVSPDVGIVELLDADGREVPPGGTGELVSTGLLNFDQPLIRYRIGDTATRAPVERSGRGRAMPLVSELMGRVEDTVVGPDGRQMVRFHGLFVDVPHLVGAQVVQEALDRVVIRVLAEPGFAAAEERLIASRFRSQLAGVEVTVTRVDRLARNASGKIPAVISRLRSA